MVIISLLGILFVMVSDARPIKDYLSTSSLTDLIGGHGKRAAHSALRVSLVMLSVLQFI